MGEAMQKAIAMRHDARVRLNDRVARGSCHRHCFKWLPALLPSQRASYHIFSAATVEGQVAA